VFRTHFRVYNTFYSIFTEVAIQPLLPIFWQHYGPGVDSASNRNDYQEYFLVFNPLALELDIYSLAHHLCKMLIFYEPRRVTLGNTRNFVEE